MQFTQLMSSMFPIPQRGYQQTNQHWFRRLLVKTSTNPNVDNQNLYKPKRLQTKTSTKQNVDNPKRRQTETSTNQNVDKPKRRQNETSTSQNVDRPKRRQTETSTKPKRRHIKTSA